MLPLPTLRVMIKLRCMPSIRLHLALLPLLASAAAFAQSGSEAGDADTDFDLPGADASMPGSDLALDDANFVGNPLKRLAKKWPEDLVVAPIPGYSPQLGWNLTLGGGYFLDDRDEDDDTPPSILGGFIMGAENGSYAYAGGANLHLLEDKLRIKGGAGYADIRYRFYARGDNPGDLGFGLDLLQNGPLYFATGSWNVWRRLYVGIGYLGGSVKTRPRLTQDEAASGFSVLDLDIGAYTIPIEIDSRDHEQFPRKGWLIEARGSLYRESVGSDFDAQIFKLSANHYRPIGDTDVFATRAVFRTSSGNAPFFLLSTFGGSKDLRGYPSGRYRDRMMYALQGEYRWHVNDRWIVTGFAGFGEVAENVSDFGSDFLPAAGAGLRYVLSQKHRIGLSADIGVGKDGAEFYFGVGEAF